MKALIAIPRTCSSSLRAALVLPFALVACDADVSAPDQHASRSASALTSSGMSLYVPAYYTSTDSSLWNQFLSELPDITTSGGTPVTAIVTGSASEPDAVYDWTLAGNIASIHAKGHYAIGYVDWMPRTASCDQLNHNCNGRWNDLPIPCTGDCIAEYALDNMYRWYSSPDSSGIARTYAVDGIFIDDAQRTDAGDLPYAQLIVATARRLVSSGGFTVFNPGTYSPIAALQTYVDCDVQSLGGANTRWVDWERPATDLDYDHTVYTNGDPMAQDFNWAASYASWRFVHLGYSLTTDSSWPSVLDETMTTVSQRNAAGVFLTNNDWSTPPDPNVFAREYNNGNTGAYSFQNTSSDFAQCTGNCDPGTCLTCSCPAPIQATLTSVSDDGITFCKTLNVTNDGTTPVSSWAVSVRIDDGTLASAWTANFSGSTRILLATSSSLSLAPGATDSSAGFCVSRTTAGTGALALAAIGSP